MAGRVVLEADSEVATVEISNPGKRNALNGEMWSELRTLFRGLAKQETLRCVVVRGEGEHFAAGADIEEFHRIRSTRAQVTEYHERLVGEALAAIYECPVPVVAGISGACAGGGLEIASVCDLRIAARSSRLGIPIRLLGFPLAPREMEWLVRLVGPAVTAELLFEGRMLSADEAFAKGILTRVVDDDALADEVRRCVRSIVDGAPLAARINKQQLRRLMADSRPFTPEERLNAYAFADTEDYRIGVQAFLDKRPPKFRGR